MEFQQVGSSDTDDEVLDSRLHAVRTPFAHRWHTVSTPFARTAYVDQLAGARQRGCQQDPRLTSPASSLGY
jgi:hypothetical protein